MKRLLLALACMATLATAQPRQEMMDDDTAPMGRGHRMEQLKLTDDQEKQVDKLRSDMQKDQIALHSKIKTLRVDLREQFGADKPERGKIESLISEIGKLQTDAKLRHHAFWFDVNKLLTADQQKLWKEHRGMGMRDGESGMMGGRRMMKGRGMMEGRGMMRHRGRGTMECERCDGGCR